MFLSDLPAVLLAALVGLVASASGIGGGSFLVPYLMLAGHLSPHQAVGTSLAVIIPASLAATVQYAVRRNISGRLAAWLLPPAAVGAVGGALLARQLPGKALTLLFALFLLLMGGRMLRSVLRPGEGGEHRAEGPEPPRGALLLTGFLAGFSGAALGIGGGFLVAPVLILGYNVPARRTVAVSMAVVATVSLAGAAMHLSAGAVSPRLAVVMGVGLLAGSLGGPWLAHRVSERALRGLIGAVLLSMGMITLGRGIG